MPVSNTQLFLGDCLAEIEPFPNRVLAHRHPGATKGESHA